VAPKPSNTRAVVVRVRVASIAGSAIVLASVACSSHSSKCGAPSSGTFTLSLAYAQTLPVAVDCPAAASQAATCSTPAPAWQGTLSVGSKGTFITSSDGGGDSSWTCGAIAPESASVDDDDSGAPATACYLLVNCNQTTPGGIGSIQFQLLGQGTTADVLAIVKDAAGDCCVNEYTGTWK
jgi:hypothetical protein